MSQIPVVRHPGAQNSPSPNPFTIIGKLARFLLGKSNTLNLQLFENLAKAKEDELSMVRQKLQSEPESTDISSWTNNPVVVVSLLLEYLTQLPEPLLTYHMYDSFIMTDYLKDPGERIRYRQLYFDSIPPQYKYASIQVLVLLHRIALNSGGMSKMEDIVAIFTRLFLRPERATVYHAHDDQLARKTLMEMISEYDKLFSNEEVAKAIKSIKEPITTPARTGFRTFSSAPATPTTFSPARLSSPAAGAQGVCYVLDLTAAARTRKTKRRAIRHQKIPSIGSPQTFTMSDSRRDEDLSIRDDESTTSTNFDDVSTNKDDLSQRGESANGIETDDDMEDEEDTTLLPPDDVQQAIVTSAAHEAAQDIGKIIDAMSAERQAETAEHTVVNI